MFEVFEFIFIDIMMIEVFDGFMSHSFLFVIAFFRLEIVQLG